MAFFDLLAVEVRCDARELLRARDELVLGEAGRHLHAAADTAVHLDDELEGLALEERGVGLGPRRSSRAARGRAAATAPP